MSRHTCHESSRGQSRLGRRRWSLHLPLVLLASSAVVAAGPAPRAPALTPECVQSTTTTVVCTYVGPAGSSWSVPTPAGATELDLLVIGASGGNTGGASGGRGARITRTMSVSGSETFLVQFPNDGGLPGPGAGAGGGSARLLLSPSTVLVHAAGGGGAGASSGSNAGGFGGQAGGPNGSLGGNGSGDARGGLGATISNHGPGGDGACTSFPPVCLDDGDPGTSAHGGNGGADALSNVGGGGGGGGAFKGGGGGAGFDSPGASGAGGGGGSSVIPSGAVFSTDSTGRRVVLTFRSPLGSAFPAGLDLGPVSVGTSSTQFFQLRNAGSAPMTISNIGTFGPFSRSTNCFSGPLAPNATCIVNVTFSPVTTGYSSASVIVTSNSMDGVMSIPVAGIGVQALASPTPSSLSFAPTLVGDESATQTVTLRNSGSASLQITSADLTGVAPGEFVETNDGCTGASLPPNATCTVSVAFRPTSTGAKSAQLRFVDNAPNSPQNIALSGTGTLPAVTVTSSLDFGALEIGASSAPMTATIENVGSGPLQVSGVSLAGADPDDFVIGSHSCVATIPAGGTCEVPVTFSPQHRGARTASLRFTDSAAGSPHEVALEGTALALGDLQVRGPGSAYTRGQGSLVTLGVTAGKTASHDVKVVNTSAVARSFEITLTQDQAAATATLLKGSRELPKNPTGHYVTAVLAPGKSAVYVLKVKPLGTGQVTSGVAVHLIAPNGAEHDGVRTETNVRAPKTGTDAFGVFVRAGSQPYIGGAVDGQTATANSVVLGKSTKFTALLRNDSTAPTAMTFRMSGATNACWTTTVTTKEGVSTVDISAAATGGGYLTKVLSPGGSTKVTIALQRIADGCSAMSWQVSSYDGAVQQHFSFVLANPAL
ncbi:choice-of-anchor D domain-containing protein [Nocardioides humilatus]|uniref:Choice-of-anchor D domain-containing protein n=1 Tax=Nocardioides humilatus TaxID=2607660 RepID=A0A5B1LDI3_9ACTN|nr:choice-of-anchor D domain-containing protein [Nocardioides humilatus]KAA1418791.1 choice-of-anchor D domain-containing protein [Nocardioides humilatus]